MSKYVVTSSSYFEPFTYDELAKPIQQMTEAHNAAADAYDQISLETEALRNYITNNPGDYEAKAMYDNYVNKLNVLKDNLWNHGYSAGTRRDLSAARAAYASDITRLQTAIQTRQARSNEYWKARHDHPELVSGFDPGLSGLDNYLHNENYGNDWFSYNGNNFVNEVATEAKARAGELMELTAGKSGVPGYLMQIQQSGFTNKQIDGAGVLARKVLKGEAKLNDIPSSSEELLASVLISRLNSTGANPNSGGNISTDEFDRLFNYGMLGLSQGVGELNKKYIDDKVWEQQQKENLERIKHNLNNPTPSTSPFGYSFNGVSAYSEDENSDVLNNLFRNKGIDYSNNPINVKVNGELRTVNDAYDAESILNEMGWSKIFDKYGVDPETEIPKENAIKSKRLLVSGKERRRNKATGEEYDVSTLHNVYQMNDRIKKRYFSGDAWANDKSYTPVVFEQEINGKPVLDVNKTREYNRDNYYYKAQRDKFVKENEDNPNFNINKFAVVGRTRRDIYKELDIPINIEPAVAEQILNIKNRQGYTTPVQIANITQSEAANKLYSGYVQNFYAQNVGKIPEKELKKKGSTTLGFYPRNPNGRGFAEEPITSSAAVLGTKGTGNNAVTNYDNIVGFNADPYDIVNEDKLSIVTAGDKEYGVNPYYLGNLVGAMTESMRRPYPEKVNGENVNINKGILDYLLMPINDPARAYRMSEKEQEQWSAIAMKRLGRYGLNLDIKDEGGRSLGRFLPEHIIMSNTQEMRSMFGRDLQAELDNAIRLWMFSKYAEARDYELLHPEQHVSATSAKALAFNILNTD